MRFYGVVYTMSLGDDDIGQLPLQVPVALPLEVRLDLFLALSGQGTIDGQEIEDPGSAGIEDDLFVRVSDRPRQLLADAIGLVQQSDAVVLT